MMMHTHLQHMVEDIPDSMLPQAWVDHDLEFFSHAKRLYDYQQQALRNALKALWKYYWGVESPLTPPLSPLEQGGRG
jgi:type III restriction enzyme